MSSDAKIAAVKIGGNRRLILGVVCRCGGALYIDDCHRNGEFRFETFCGKCRTCDPNGWPTIRKALDNARAYFRPTSDHQKGTP